MQLSYSNAASTPNNFDKDMEAIYGLVNAEPSTWDSVIKATDEAKAVEPLNFSLPVMPSWTPSTESSAASNTFNIQSTLSAAELRKKQADERRKIKNRERVRKCRKRKQDRLTYLEGVHAELSQENVRLRLKTQHYGSEKLSEDEKASVNTQQVEVLEKMVASFANDKALASAAADIWTDNARVIHPLSGLSSTGVPQILKHQSVFNKAAKNLKVTDYSVQHDPTNVRKPRVNWSFMATMDSFLPAELSNTALAKIWHVIAGKSLVFKGKSFITFEDNKIQEDIRTLDTLHLMTQLQQAITDPFEMAQAVQALASL